MSRTDCLPCRLVKGRLDCLAENARQARLLSDYVGGRSRRCPIRDVTTRPRLNRQAVRRLEVEALCNPAHRSASQLAVTFQGGQLMSRPSDVFVELRRAITLNCAESHVHSSRDRENPAIPPASPRRIIKDQTHAAPLRHRAFEHRPPPHGALGSPMGR